MMMMMMVQMVVAVGQIQVVEANFTEAWLLQLLGLLKLGRVLDHVVLDRGLQLWRLLVSELLLLRLGLGRGQGGKLEQIVVMVGMGVVLELLERQRRVEGGGGSVGKEGGLLLL